MEIIKDKRAFCTLGSGINSLRTGAPVIGLPAVHLLLATRKRVHNKLSANQLFLTAFN